MSKRRISQVSDDEGLGEENRSEDGSVGSDASDDDFSLFMNGGYSERLKIMFAYEAGELLYSWYKRRLFFPPEDFEPFENAEITGDIPEKVTIEKDSQDMEHMIHFIKSDLNGTKFRPYLTELKGYIEGDIKEKREALKAFTNEIEIDEGKFHKNDAKINEIDLKEYGDLASLAQKMKKPKTLIQNELYEKTNFLFNKELDFRVKVKIFLETPEAVSIDEDIENYIISVSDPDDQDPEIYDPKDFNKIMDKKFQLDATIDNKEAEIVHKDIQKLIAKALKKVIEKSKTEGDNEAAGNYEKELEKLLAKIKQSGGRKRKSSKKSKKLLRSRRQKRKSSRRRH